MDGFKDSTKMKYMCGGMADAPMKKAMGGSVVKPTMGKPMMAKGGDTKPMMKKAEGGMMSKRPSAGKSVESGKRMSKMMAKEERSLDRTMPGKGRITERELRMLEERFPIDTLVERLRSRMPSAGESVESGNRMSRMEAEEARAMGVFKKGGLAVMPKKGK